MMFLKVHWEHNMVGHKEGEDGNVTFYVIQFHSHYTIGAGRDKIVIEGLMFQCLLICFAINIQVRKIWFQKRRIGLREVVVR